MSFFEPLPPMPPQPHQQWSAPLWDRPSEGTLPAVLPINEIVDHRDDMVIEIELFRVYRTGFTVELLALRNPHASLSDRASWLSFGHGPGPPSRHFPRVGVRFADGRVGGRGPQQEIEKDEDGFPVDPVVLMTGGGSSGHGLRLAVWVYPIPPAGPLEIFVALPGHESEEKSTTVDGEEVRRAAERAAVIWS